MGKRRECLSRPRLTVGPGTGSAPGNVPSEFQRNVPLIGATLHVPFRGKEVNLASADSVMRMILCALISLDALEDPRVDAVLKACKVKITIDSDSFILGERAPKLAVVGMVASAPAADTGKR